MANIKIKDANSDIKYLKAIGSGSALDPNVAIQDNYVLDQASPVINLPLVHKLIDATLAVQAAIDEYTITVTSAVGIQVGHHIRIINTAADKYWIGECIDINGSVLTLDTPLDFDYELGSGVTASTLNMAVDGSSTPVVFTGRTGSPSIPSDFDITRIIFMFETDTPPLWTDFGDIEGGIANGVVFRASYNNGVILANIFNIKSNSDLAGHCYELEFLDQVGIDGIKARMTFAGQEKIGVSIRIGIDDNIEMVIQDNLLALSKFTVYAQGHVAN
jgi:hypothetical protein